MSEKININKPETFFIAILVLTSSVAFFLGKISEQYKISLEKKEEITLTKNSLVDGLENIQLVASSRGTKYHLPWCSGALSMSEANKINL